MATLPGWKDKALFTPGPLTTSRSVKQAMLRDMGSRDDAFIEIVRSIRADLVHLAGGGADYTAVLMQGSGTFAIEATLGSVIPRGGKLLLGINGAYGHRMAEMVRVLGIPCESVIGSEDVLLSPDALDAKLAADPAITHVAVVHCETTTGILNPIADIAARTRARGHVLIVDAMSSFGAVPINIGAMGIDYLISSANKCIEGVPGFAFVIARQSLLEQTRGWARSLSLDLHAQWKGLEANGQFRFTPPTHALLAFRQALDELASEGGVGARAARYRANHEALVHGMRQIGFEEYLDPALQGYIITSFRFPEHQRFSFPEFYRRLSDRDVLIYPGKVSNADCFRIGTIGRLNQHDIACLLSAIRGVLEEMKIELPANSIDVLIEI